MKNLLKNISTYLQNLWKVKQTNDLYASLITLEIFGGLMDRHEFVKKIKQTLRLLEKRKQWIEQSIWNTPNFPQIEELVNLEKQINKDYETAVRGGKAKDEERWWNQGRLDLVLQIKDIMKKNYGDRDTRTSPGKTPYLE